MSERFLDIRVNDEGIGMSVVDHDRGFTEELGYYLWEDEKWSHDNSSFVWWLYTNLVAIGYEDTQIRNDFDGDIRKHEDNIDEDNDEDWNEEELNEHYDDDDE